MSKHLGLVVKMPQCFWQFSEELGDRILQALWAFLFRMTVILTPAPVAAADIADGAISVNYAESDRQAHRGLTLPVPFSDCRGRSGSPRVHRYAFPEHVLRLACACHLFGYLCSITISFLGFSAGKKIPKGNTCSGDGGRRLFARQSSQN